MSNSFSFASIEKNGAKTYYHFAVVTDKKIQQNSSGFAGGLTISTEAGKITGESLLIKPGADPDVGNRLASILCLTLTYEALGKPIPVTDKDKQIEFDAYIKAVEDAMDGRPGHINYPGYSSQLLFSKTADGNFLFVLNPSPPQTKPANATSRPVSKKTLPAKNRPQIKSTKKH